MESATERDQGVAAARTRPLRGRLLSPQAASHSRDPFAFFITVVFCPRPIWALSGTPAGLITGVGPPPLRARGRSYMRTMGGWASHLSGATIDINGAGYMR